MINTDEQYRGQLPPGGHWESSGQEYVVDCPECGKRRKFSFNVHKAIGYCFSCQFKVRGWTGLARAFGSLEAAPPRPQPQLRESKPSERIPAWGNCAALLYLAGRGVDAQLCDDAGIEFDPGSQRIYCPTWSPFGLPPSWMSRSILPGEKGWRESGGASKKSKYLFGVKPAKGPLVLVEGVFDVLTPGLWGNAYALLGSALNAELELWLIREHTSFIVWLDPDAEAKAADLTRRLGAHRPTACVRGPEPGSCSRVEAAQHIGEAIRHYVSAR